MELDSSAKNEVVSNYEAWSSCGRYGLRISSQIMSKILRFCRMSAQTETGGILVGYYTRRRDCAIVTDCSAPPVDSVCKRTIFHRGIEGLQQWILGLWNLKYRRYYIGEWHFHVLSSSTPSQIDVEQIKSTSEKVTYRCPEPIMVIVGGDASKDWSCKSFVYSQKEGLMELSRGRTIH